MIPTRILDKLLDMAISSAAAALKRASGSLVSTRDDLDSAITQHVLQVNNWSERVSFADLKKPKFLLDVFVELELFAIPKRRHHDVVEKTRRVPLIRIFDDKNLHFALLGEPGAGKTTSMKFLCQELLCGDALLTDISFPLVVRLNELNAEPKGRESVLIRHLKSILGLVFEFPNEARPSHGEDIQKAEKDFQKRRMQPLLRVLDELRVLLILDGFDELVSDKRDEVVDTIKELARGLDTCVLIVTSRTGEFPYSIDRMIQYELSSFNSRQISTFVSRWLQDETAANTFLAKIQDSPFSDTAIRPLTLAHLCALYERLGYIPDKPKSIYRKVVQLLLEEWDEQRSIRRVSKYANFEADRKYDFLASLAYEMTVSLRKIRFTKDDLLEIYQKIHEEYDLPENEAQKVVNELESHTGLFIQQGYDRYEFAHKSLQEYLTAYHLVRLPSIPEGASLFNLPNELAIAITISSNQSQYFVRLIIRRFLRITSVLPKEFMPAFLSRLQLEKPDFIPSYNLGFALIILYSRCIEHGHPPHVIGRFESLIRPLITQQIRDRIKMCYTPSEQSFGLLRLKLVEVVKASGPDGSSLPEVLIVRTQLGIAGGAGRSYDIES